jgi:flagellar basal-body rod protein FlgG
MISALNIAATGMNVSVDQINITASNLSNLQTVGFKNMMMVSTDLKYQTKTPAGSIRHEGAENAPTGIQFGAGAKTAATFRIIKQGESKETNDPFHIAIQGNGYFKVMVGDKEYYTRSGSFKRNRDGIITTNEGYPLVGPQSIPDEFAGEYFAITEGGVIQSKQSASDQSFTQFGKIPLFRFPNEAGLTAVGNQLFEETPDASGVAVQGDAATSGFGDLIQKHLEQSTVDAVEELTNAIAAQRAYELNSKIIKIADEMLSSANQIK